MGAHTSIKGEGASPHRPQGHNNKILIKERDTLKNLKGI